MIRHATTLRDALDHYCLLHPLAAETEYQMRHSGELLERFRGGTLLLDQLSERLVNEWLKSLEEEEYARRTVVNHRNHILMVWRAAADADLVREPRARLIRRIKKPRPRPKAWTRDELRRVLAAAGGLDGVAPRGVLRKVYFTVLIHMAYETGLRRGDLWRLAKSEVSAEGRLYRQQHKTEEDQACQLSPQTLDRFTALPGELPLAWPKSNASTYYNVWRRICKRAGVPHGSTQKIRRTGATHLWLEDPDGVQAYLGHRTAEMRWHYIDKSLGPAVAPRPPAIE